MSRSKDNQAHSLISYYEMMYRDKYGKKPLLNRYRDKWGFDAMIEDLGEPDARRVIDYYFTTGKLGHPLIYLFRNYDRLYKIMQELVEDEAKRKLLREQTEIYVKEWEERVGEHRSEGDQRPSEE